MAFSCGFYNAVNYDRTYSAVQFGEMFDGLITDGVYSTIGEIFATVPGDGLSVKVKSGRAWFNKTWSVNTTDLPLDLDLADFLLPRKDTVILEVDTRVSTRDNSIKVVTGYPATNPVPARLTNSDGLYQYPLAYVTVAANATAITKTDIEITVGRDPTPFVTGILESVSITDMYQQWQGQFEEWFQYVQSQLSGDIAANLQRQIDERVKTSDMATTIEDTNKWVPARLLKKSSDDAFNAYGYEIGDIKISSRDLSSSFTDFAPCDGRMFSKNLYQDLFSKIGFRNGVGIELVKAPANKTEPYERVYPPYIDVTNSRGDILRYAKTYVGASATASVISTGSYNDSVMSNYNHLSIKRIEGSSFTDFRYPISSPLTSTNSVSAVSIFSFIFSLGTDFYFVGSADSSSNLYTSEAYENGIWMLNVDNTWSKLASFGKREFRGAIGFQKIGVTAKMILLSSKGSTLYISYASVSGNAANTSEMFNVPRTSGSGVNVYASFPIAIGNHVYYRYNKNGQLRRYDWGSTSSTTISEGPVFDFYNLFPKVETNGSNYWDVGFTGKLTYNSDMSKIAIIGASSISYANDMLNIYTLSTSGNIGKYSIPSKKLYSMMRSAGSIYMATYIRVLDSKDIIVLYYSEDYIQEITIANKGQISLTCDPRFNYMHISDSNFVNNVNRLIDFNSISPESAIVKPSNFVLATTGKTLIEDPFVGNQIYGEYPVDYLPISFNPKLVGPYYRYNGVIFDGKTTDGISAVSNYYARIDLNRFFIPKKDSAYIKVS